MKKTIWFDMDGVVCDLYSVENWLPKLRAEDNSPYLEARPLFSMNVFAKTLHAIQRAGYAIGVISWTSKESSEAYHEAVKSAKLKWLNQHLHSVNWDNIHIIHYGEPKEQFSNGNDILFDDEEKNRNNWLGTAFDEKNICQVLKTLI